MWQYHPVLLLFLLGVLVSLGVAAYCAWRLWRRTFSAMVALVGVLALFNAILNAASTMKVASPGLEAKLLFYKLEFFGAAVNPSVAIALALVYLGMEQWLSRGAVAALIFIPASWIALVFANPEGTMITEPRLVSHGGIYALEHSFPPLFLAYQAWGLGALLFSGLLLVGRGLFGRSPSGKRTYASAILVGVALLLPVGSTLLKMFGVYPPGGSGINVTPAFTTASLGMIALAIGRYHFFELLPVGRRRALSVMDDGYLLATPSGEIVDANSAARRLLGGTAETTLVGQRIEEVLPGESFPGEGLPDKKGTPPDEAKLSPSKESFSLTKEGRAVQAHATPIREGGRAVGQVLILRDVTPLREREKKLEQENERLDRFASVLSHDLRNPLNVAQGRLELAREKFEKDPEDHLSSTGRALGRMDEIIEDMLLLTWSEREIDPEELEVADLKEVGRKAWENVEAPEATFETETSARLVCHEGRVQRLFENLFHNAIEHGGTGVTITVGTLPGEGPPSGFYVEDDGPGIPEEKREKVLESGYSSREEGTGLGLSIIKGIAEAHGWSISVAEGRKGGGARFEFHGAEFRCE